MELWRWLEGAGAHHDVVEWARPYGGEWARAWAACPRGDCLLGIAAKRGVDRRAIVGAAAACARIALAQVPDDEPAPLHAIEIAERWSRGEAVDPAEPMRALEGAIERSPDPAVSAAASAALAALHAIEAPGDAATAAAAVAQAAVYDAGECAMMSALAYAHHECAERVRARLPAIASE
ncbi:MAG: hypothetical protein IT378_04065 [Sandaracinaceae bacterium]|nr:hypothetical protein [Sandaracinaceae bacterium]